MAPRHPTKVHKAGFTFNDKVVVFLAGILGSPWTIYLFVGLALVSLPEVLATKSIVLIDAWIAQTFIQLVALAILQAKAVQDGGHSEEIANAIFDNAVKSERQNEEILDLLAKLLKKKGK
jgi:hypothetical protein